MAFNIGFYAYAIIGHAYTGQSTPTTALDGTLWYFAYTM